MYDEFEDYELAEEEQDYRLRNEILKEERYEINKKRIFRPKKLERIENESLFIDNRKKKQDKLRERTGNEFQFYLLHSETQNYYSTLNCFNNNKKLIDKNHFLESHHAQVYHHQENYSSYNNFTHSSSSSSFASTSTIKLVQSMNTTKRDVIFINGKGKMANEDKVKNVYAYISYDHDEYGPTIYLEAREGFSGFKYPTNFSTLKGDEISGKNIKIEKKNYFKPNLDLEDSCQSQFIFWLQDFLDYNYKLQSSGNHKNEYVKGSNSIIYPNANSIIAFRNVTNSNSFSKSSYYYVPDVEEGGPHRHVIELRLSSKKAAIKLIKIFDSDMWMDFVYSGFVPTIRTFESNIPFDLQWRCEMNINFGNLHIVDSKRIEKMSNEMIEATFNLTNYSEDCLFYIIPYDAICLAPQEDNTKTTATTKKGQLPFNYMDCSLYPNLKYILPKKIFFDIEVNNEYNHLMSCTMFPVAKWTSDILLNRYQGIIEYSWFLNKNKSFSELRKKIIHKASKSEKVRKIVRKLIRNSLILEKIPRNERSEADNNLLEITKFIRLKYSASLNDDNLSNDLDSATMVALLEKLIRTENDTDKITIIAAVSRTTVEEKSLESDGGGIIFTWGNQLAFNKDIGLNIRNTKEFGNIKIHCYRTELDMLEVFFRWLYYEKPDFIGGHNIRGFDLNYIYDRYKILGGKNQNCFSILKNAFEQNYVSQFDRGSSIKSKRTYSIPGGPQIFDTLTDGLNHETFGHGNGKDLPWNLSAVSTFFLLYPGTKEPMRKLEIEIEKGKEMFMKGGDGLSYFLGYCLFDALLSAILIEKWSSVTNMFFVATTTGVAPAIVYFKGVKNLHYIFNYKLIYNDKLQKKFIYPDITLNTREFFQADLWYDHYDNGGENISLDVRYLYEHDPFMKKRWELGEIRKLPNVKTKSIYNKMILKDDSFFNELQPKETTTMTAGENESNQNSITSTNNNTILEKMPVETPNKKRKTKTKSKTDIEIECEKYEDSNPNANVIPLSSLLPKKLPDSKVLGYEDGTTNIYLPDVKNENYLKYNNMGSENKEFITKRKKNFKHLKYCETRNGFLIAKTNILSQEKPFMGGHCFPVTRHVNYNSVVVTLDYVSLYPSIAYSVCMCTSTMVTEKLKRMFGIKFFELVKVTLGPSEKIQIGNVEKSKLQQNIQQLYSDNTDEIIDTAYIYFIQITDIEQTLYPKSIQLLFQSRKRAKALMALYKKCCIMVSDLIGTLTKFRERSASKKIEIENFKEMINTNITNVDVKNETLQISRGGRGESDGNENKNDETLDIDTVKYNVEIKRSDYSAKELLYNTKQNSDKLAMNSSFGVQCGLVGASITAFGRLTIRTCYNYLNSFDVLIVLIENRKNLFDLYIERMKQLKKEFKYILKTIVENDAYLKTHFTWLNIEELNVDKLWEMDNLQNFMLNFILEIKYVYDQNQTRYSVHKSHGDTDSVIMYFPILFLSPFFHNYVHKKLAVYIGEEINELCIKNIIDSGSISSSSSSSSSSKEEFSLPLIIQNDRQKVMMDFEVDGDVCAITSEVQQKKSYIMLIGYKFNEETGKDEPVFSVKGIASKKGNGVPYAVNLEKEILYNRILKPLNWEENETRIMRARSVLLFMRDKLKELILGNFNIKDFEMAVKLNRPIETYKIGKKVIEDHVQVALKKMKRGEQVETNSKINFVFIMPNLESFEDDEKILKILNNIDNLNPTPTVKGITENRIPDDPMFAIKNSIPLDLSYYIQAKIVPKLVKFYAPLIFNHESYLSNPPRLSVEKLKDLSKKKKKIINQQQRIAKNLILDEELTTMLNNLEAIKYQMYTLMSISQSGSRAFPPNLQSQCKECGKFFQVELFDILPKLLESNHHDDRYLSNNSSLNSISTTPNFFDSTQNKKKPIFAKILEHPEMNICSSCFSNRFDLQKKYESSLKTLEQIFGELREKCWQCIDMTKVSVKSSFYLKNSSSPSNSGHSTSSSSSSSSSSLVSNLSEIEKKAKYQTCPEDCTSVKCPIHIKKEKIKYEISKNRMKSDWIKVFDW